MVAEATATFCLPSQNYMGWPGFLPVIAGTAHTLCSLIEAAEALLGVRGQMEASISL